MCGLTRKDTMEKNYKPMLAVSCDDTSLLKFPLIASPKLDGVRAIIANGVVLSRSLKPIPNKYVQERLKNLPDGLDGELIVGDPCEPDAYRKTVSVVMSDDKPIEGLVYHVFDIQSLGAFTDRLKVIEEIGHSWWCIQILRQTVVSSLEELENIEAKWTEAGHEGVILRNFTGQYKHGRSTLKEGYLLKLKRFVDAEAVVTGITELLHNDNEAMVNELGRTARSHKKEGMVSAGTMGNLKVSDIKTGVNFEVGTGFTAEERLSLWTNPPIGKLLKYKYFPTGSKDKPRHPVFLGWRDSIDL